MPLKLNSSGGGSVTLDVPATGGAFTATVPANTGTLVTTGSTAAVTPAMLTQPLTLATAQNSTSGTIIDFTGIPSWVKRITVMFNGVSTNGSASPLVQIGAGSVTSSGYNATSTSASNIVGTTNSTSGFVLFAGNSANTNSGHLILTLLGSNTWIASGVFKSSTTATCYAAGDVTLGGTLDRVRITTTNGTDAFDAGSINIMYEG